MFVFLDSDPLGDFLRSLERAVILFGKLERYSIHVSFSMGDIPLQDAEPEDRVVVLGVQILSVIEEAQAGFGIGLNLDGADSGFDLQGLESARHHRLLDVAADRLDRDDSLGGALRVLGHKRGTDDGGDIHRPDFPFNHRRLIRAETEIKGDRVGVVGQKGNGLRSLEGTVVLGREAVIESDSLASLIILDPCLFQKPGIHGCAVDVRHPSRFDHPKGAALDDRNSEDGKFDSARRCVSELHVTALILQVGRRPGFSHRGCQREQDYQNRQ